MTKGQKIKIMSLKDGEKAFFLLLLINYNTFELMAILDYFQNFKKILTLFHTFQSFYLHFILLISITLEK